MAYVSNISSLGQRKSQAGQAQILAAALFLLLVPATVIVAQNATENITGYVIANTTGDQESLNLSADPGNATAKTREPSTENNVRPPENNTKTVTQGENAAPNTTTSADETNATTPEGSANTNTTLPSNETNRSPSMDNETTAAPAQDNATYAAKTPNETFAAPPEAAPDLGVNLIVPERADRSEPFPLTAEIANTGNADAFRVEVEWILPDGISIIEGSRSHSCDVPVGGTCTSELEVAASLSSELGKHEIKVLVSHLE